MKIGILGTGFGVVHVGVFSDHPQADDVVVYSRKQESLTPILKNHKVKSTTNMDDILLDPTIDTVTIALPPKLHAEVAIKAMENGKDVICEIPVCPTLADAKRMQEVSAKTGKRVLVNLFDRFTASSKAIHELIQSGEYGKLCTLRTHTAAGPVWGYHPLPLDLLPMEMSYCSFDMLHWWFGELALKAVSAFQRDVSSSAITVLMETAGCASILLTNSALPPKTYASQGQLEASFEKATLTFRDKSWAQEGNVSEMLLYRDEDVVAVDLPESDHYFESLDYSLQNIISGKKGITDLEEALPALMLVLEVEKQLQG